MDLKLYSIISILKNDVKYYYKPEIPNPFYTNVNLDCYELLQSYKYLVAFNYSKVKKLNYILIKAARKGHLDIAKLVVLHGAKSINQAILTLINSSDPKSDNVELFVFLINNLDFGSSYLSNDNFYNCIRRNKINLVNYFLSNGISSKYMLKVSVLNDQKITDLILTYFDVKDFNYTLKDKWFDYHDKEATLKMIKLLVEKGGQNPNDYNLSYQLYRNNDWYEIAEYLFEKGYNNKEMIPILTNVATFRHCFKTLLVLIKYGAKIPEPDYLLQSGVEYNNLEIVKLAVENGADVMTDDNLLQIVIRNKYKDILAYLLEQRSIRYKTWAKFENTNYLK